MASKRHKASTTCGRTSTKLSHALDQVEIGQRERIEEIMRNVRHQVSSPSADQYYLELATEYTKEQSQSQSGPSWWSASPDLDALAKSFKLEDALCCSTAGANRLERGDPVYVAFETREPTAASVPSATSLSNADQTGRWTVRYSNGSEEISDRLPHRAPGLVSATYAWKVPATTVAEASAALGGGSDQSGQGKWWKFGGT
jgi:hypothetical protein